MGQLIEFASNGGRAQGYLAEPPGGTGIPLVVIQEWWGLVPHIEDVCERFAAEGFLALAPDLYHGETTTEPDEAGKLMMAMNLEQAAKDMSGAVDEIAALANGTRVGVTGFCMGGGLALMLATLRPDHVNACVTWYGLIPWPGVQPDWTRISGPILGHYAEQDGYFSSELALELEDELQSLDKDAEFVIHEGVDHAFFNDTRPEVYNAAAAGQAWAQTVGFLHTNLG
jgi:carboxymethylenebutenolidase